MPSPVCWISWFHQQLMLRFGLQIFIIGRELLHVTASDYVSTSDHYNFWSCLDWFIAELPDLCMECWWLGKEKEQDAADSSRKDGHNIPTGYSSTVSSGPDMLSCHPWNSALSIRCNKTRVCATGKYFCATSPFLQFLGKFETFLTSLFSVSGFHQSLLLGYLMQHSPAIAS